MAELKSHPAVFAGLLGSAAWGVPTLAVASPLDNFVEAVNNSLVLQFAIGCGAGAAIAIGIAFVVDHVSAEDEQEELPPIEQEPVIELGLDDDRWSSSSLNLMYALEREADEDPTGDLGRFRTGQITIDVPVASEEPKAAEGPRHMRRPRHARLATARVVAKSSGDYEGRHFSGAAQRQRMVVGIMSAPEATTGGRHAVRTAQAPAPQQPSEQPVEQQVEVKAVAEAKTKAASAVEALSESKALPMISANPHERLRERLAQLPSIDSRYSRTPRPVVEASVPKAETSVASNEPAAREVAADAESLSVTGRLRLRDRLAAKTKSVREVLAARLGSDSPDVPIIPRADGTTIDVGPTWFDATVAPAISGLTGGFAKLDDTASRAATVPETTAGMAAEGESSRASYISRHVAEVNIGMFPERRSADELEHEDAWEEALAAMGETIAQESPVVFRDMVGGPSTIDDPDGLEGPTGFIPFRVPAAHPEVVDTETYVDYLLRDELSHNSAQVVRRAPQAHLRVIEGGTGAIRMRKRTGDTGPTSKTGRHFAAQRFAQEA